MGHAAIEVTHSFDLGGFGRSSELLRDITSTATLSFDHTSLAHLHYSSEMISHKAMVSGAGRMKRLDFREAPELSRAVAASVDVPGRAYAHAVAADCATERYAAFESRFIEILGWS